MTETLPAMITTFPAPPPDRPATSMPPMAGATLVAPGVIRAGPPQETELLLLRDSFRIRTVVAIGDVPAEEQAVTTSLGMQLHAIPVAPAVAPTDQQVRTVVEAVDRIPLDEVLRRMPPDHQLKLRAAQLQALRDAAAAISGPDTPNVPYTALREVTR
jgi:hypothetical protein